MIETERLLLRPFLEKDAADVLEYLRKPAVNCFASMKLDSLEEAKEEMKKQGDSQRLHCNKQRKGIWGAKQCTTIFCSSSGSTWTSCRFMNDWKMRFCPGFPM